MTFDDAGRASADQFIAATELAALVGLDIDQGGWRANGQAVGAAANSDLSAQQQRFFALVRDLGEANSTLVQSWPKAPPRYWMDVSIGSGRAHISLTVSSRAPPTADCELYIVHDKKLFAGLYARRGEIEEAVGSPLEWLELPTKKASKVIARGRRGLPRPRSGPAARSVARHDGGEVCGCLSSIPVRPRTTRARPLP